MNIFEYLKKIHHLLSQEGIDFAIIGGLALGAHGVQRFTNDIDILIDGTDRLRLKQLMLKSGFHIFAESTEIIQFSGDIAVDVLCANRPISLSMLSDAKLYPALNIKVVGPEQIIGLKIQAYCNDPKRIFRDKADIAALIEKNQNLDWIKIKAYADLFEQWPTMLSLRELYQIGEK